ncbi:hypothetical protein [Mycobacterium ulcerans]|uniref:Uncharacterized protein n=1 Tax=Mycobacterium ulcerans subsp. shinshuense TaxID=1124626 RepID=A0A1B4XYT5_MYCUL|nr:hypothetical protein [Mycobacterium ulcerans]BAV39972.1 hypothetical protein SHTP_0617 [Mycobacterium ulcerans subsp. shinshuense]
MTGATGRYGPISFAVALAHILVVEFATWLCVLSVPPLAVFVLLVSLIYLSISSVVAKSPGKLGQVGRGDADWHRSGAAVACDPYRGHSGGSSLPGRLAPATGVVSGARWR